MNDRFKFRVWDIEEWGYLKCKYSKSAGYHKYTFGKHDVWHDIGYFIENNPKYYIVEQCTGLKDKNGKLIYEGDIIKDWRGNSYKVVWLNDIAQFFSVNMNDDTDGYWLDDNIQFFEIIGNVHEQAEQKDVK